jgi:hypothetical protein
MLRFDRRRDTDGAVPQSSGWAEPLARHAMAVSGRYA